MNKKQTGFDFLEGWFKLPSSISVRYSANGSAIRFSHTAPNKEELASPFYENGRYKLSLDIGGQDNIHLMELINFDFHRFVEQEIEYQRMSFIMSGRTRMQPKEEYWLKGQYYQDFQYRIWLNYDTAIQLNHFYGLIILPYYHTHKFDATEVKAECETLPVELFETSQDEQNAL